MRTLRIAVAIVIALGAFASFRSLGEEAYNPDEAMWVYIAQKSWAVFRAGAWDDPHWTDIEATWGYPNPPVAKYLIGAVLSAQGAEWEWAAGQQPPADVLVAARRASALAGLVGVLGLLALGWQTLRRSAALLGAGLLAISPLWLSASRHVLTDVFGVTLAVLAVAAFAPALEELRGARRPKVLVPWIAASGALAGLGVAAKLNAASAPVALGGILLILLARETLRPAKEGLRGAGMIVVLGVLFAGVTLAAFVVPNPYLHEDGWSRFQGILEHWKEYCAVQVERSAAGGFGAAFRPEEKGLRVLVGKMLAPPRAAGLLLLVPLAAGLLARRLRGGLPPRTCRLLGWLLLVPAAVIVGMGRNQIVHSWLPWIGLLGGGLALAVATGAERSTRVNLRTRLLVPVWGVVVAWFVWKMTMLPVSRYYLPLLPVLCLGAGYGFATLREDLGGEGSPWPRRLLDVALLCGVLSVLAAAPDHGQVSIKRLASAPLLPEILHWISVAGVLAAAAAGLVAARLRPR